MYLKHPFPRAVEALDDAPVGTLVVYGHAHFRMPNGRDVVRKVRLAHDFMVPSLEIAEVQTREIRDLNPEAKIVGKLTFTL